jgi:hypothetical protein
LPARLALEVAVHGKPPRGQERHLELGKQRLLRLRRPQIAERRALRALDADRHEPRVGPVDDHGGPVVGLHEPTGERDTALREDDDRLARLHRVDEGARGQWLGRLQQARVDDAQEGAYPPSLRDLIVDGEARLLGQNGMQQRPVEQAHVVGGEDDALSGAWNILKAAHFEPKKKAKNRATGVAHDLRAPDVHDIGDGGDAEHAEHCKQEWHADAGPLQPRDDATRSHHVGGVEHVDRGDDARTPVHGSPRLHGGERGDDVEAAGDRQTAETNEQCQASAGGEHLGGADRLWRGRQDRGDPGDAQGKDAHQQGAQRHQPEVGLAVARPRCQHGADGDADREHGQAHRHHALAAADVVLDHGRHQRQGDGADQPEPGDNMRAAP